ncbi:MULTISPECIES: TRAP transporter substrate-binding protein DctP [Pseudomonadota]|jgi:TRAP-type transport system periplasmic protein|uniref:TRAP transporter substrate-binding protein DctP n=1 Tax=Pseudomonadota TaxID=1224 RepID=UPI00257E3053|nr:MULTISPECIES: TRAP transporter substrate-binding protein DctP [Marinobacter]WOI19744.1 TRAP transporter substrate-binding protein DctP [Marinobacter salarius]|tara:strand:- start:4058 stop:5035 length:978 start_codon:yes stop_codon:yes gene_type:complete
MNKKNLYLSAFLVCVALLFSTSTSVFAKEKTEITAISGFNMNTALTRTFEKFVEKINSDENSPIQIKLIGGPEAMPPFQIGNAVKNGVVDMILSTGAFYSNVMPSADALKLTNYSPQQLRETGKWPELQKIWKDEMNVHLLAFTNYNNQFHLYTNKPIESAQLDGQRLRVTPIYRSFFEALGASVVQTAPGEVYTALERGVVDGYGWTMQGIFDLGWQEQTKYRIDPGFYHAEVTVMINERKWDSLSTEQQNYLTDNAIWLESLNDENESINKIEQKRQAESGIEVITLQGTERKKFLDVAKDAAWADVIKNSPNVANRIKTIIE